MNNQNALPKRNETDVKYQWRLEDLYATDALWEEEYAEIQEKINSLSKFQNTLSLSAQNLLDCLTACYAVSQITDKLYVYSFMRFHEDSTNSFYQSLSDRAEMLAIS